jgi:leader peptidase (prepilin peptidase) / N-methyltransferase
MREIAPGIDRPRRYAATAVAGVAVETVIAWRFGWSLTLPAYLIFGAAGTIVSITDLATRRIPNAIVLPAYPVAGAMLVAASAADGRWWPLARGGIAATVVAGFYLALALALPGQLGLGDVRLGGLLGLALGWLAWPAVATGVFTAWCLAMLALGWRRVRRRPTGGLALGPYLCLGALAAIVSLK